LLFLTLKFKLRGYCFVSIEEFQQTAPAGHTVNTKRGLPVVLPAVIELPRTE
jgi:hypothetical protein